jgi:L-asparaginase/archaeal Glu-tRNAGln amidotransferase subunit D
MVRILIIGVGGTIASVVTEGGTRPGMGPAEILEEALGGNLPAGIEVKICDLMRVDSSLMLPEDWVNIATTIYRNYSDYDSFLILHGTDTMAYTAAALAFSLRGLGKPVVLTGSMKTLRESGTDVPKNLRDSLVFSREAPKLGLSGVYIVFNGKVILGVRASKVNAADVDAFTSVNYPYIARVSGEEVAVEHKPSRRVEGELKAGGIIR